METIVEYLRILDAGALLTIIFLIGAAYQRLKAVERFIQNHKVFHEKVLRIEAEQHGMEEKLTNANREINAIKERCFNLHQRREANP